MVARGWWGAGERTRSQSPGVLERWGKNSVPVRKDVWPAGGHRCPDQREVEDIRKRVIERNWLAIGCFTRGFLGEEVHLRCDSKELQIENKTIPGHRNFTCKDPEMRERKRNHP